MSGYVELQTTTNFTFLTGASHPEELAQTAAALGHAAVAITDTNTLAGAVRGHLGARDAGVRAIIGARLETTDAPPLLCYPTDRAAYGRLSRLISTGRRRAPKGDCRLTRADIDDFAEGQIFIALPPDGPDADFADFLAEFARTHAGAVHLAACCRHDGLDARRLAHLAELAARADAPLVATNDVVMHAPERRPLADVLACIRGHVTIDEAGLRLSANAERHLKPPGEMARLFRDHPDAVARTVEIAARCRFSLDELRYEYPIDPVPDGRTPDEELARLARVGAKERYPAGTPKPVAAQIRRELGLIAELGYAPYFLTVHDIVRFARRRGILCQGRGSAANSAVCYCLGITAIDPDRFDLLFERFVSAERGEPPDIDVDFEHERREEVIQYIYGKYGREHAGLAATVIRYRTRSALRDVGKALGLSEDIVSALAGQVWGRSNEPLPQERIRELGLDPADRRLRQAMALARELTGFPRHLSQHVGGFVITRGRLDELAPIENAAMDDRTVIEWDKDDLEALGILKIDVLALGMLTCIRKCFDLLERHHGIRHTLATVPAEDPAVYDMLCQADAVGVFQVESRAQMAFLPRMKPRNFYDLVIEVAIVRPGPIQGGMVHPYLRRRNGKERVDFPSDELRTVLGKTLGVPLFQEQAMKIAIVAAGFTPAEADGLRRAMATFRKSGLIHTFRAKMIGGMIARGYDADFAERCFRQIEGFGEYGFPESHAVSFALLVYVSAWFKCHHPDVFAAALLNSQPMGFYAPAQIVRCAREHGVVVRRPDVNHAHWDCTLEPADSAETPAKRHPRIPGERHALRLGFRQIKGFPKEAAQALAAARGDGYASVDELWRRADLEPDVLERLAKADAFGSLGLVRRQALWAVKGLAREVGGTASLPLFDGGGLHGGAAAESQVEPPAALPTEQPGEALAGDYATIRMSLDHHPLALLRDEMAGCGAAPAATLAERASGGCVAVAGIVLVRQRPGSANGIIFMTLEDETGIANAIVRPDVFARFRKVVLTARLVLIRGVLQREGIVTHVIAREIVDMSDRLDMLARGDERFGETEDGGRPDPHGATAKTRRRPVPSNPSRHPRNATIRIASHDFH